MIMEDEIEEASEKYMKSDELRYFQEICDYDVRDAFIAGAKWSLSNQWHSVSKDLPCDHPELIDEDDTCCTKCVICTSVKGTYYADYMLKSRVSKEWKWSAKDAFDCKRWMAIPV